MIGSSPSPAAQVAAVAAILSGVADAAKIDPEACVQLDDPDDQNIAVVDTRGMSLSGSISPDLSQLALLPFLVELHLSGHSRRLAGNLEAMFQSLHALPRLEVLSVARCGFTGAVLADCSGFPRSLIAVDLRDNEFDSRVDWAKLAALDQLTDLLLDSNRFDGPVLLPLPPNLLNFSIAGNCFSGALDLCRVPRTLRFIALKQRSTRVAESSNDNGAKKQRFRRVREKLRLFGDPKTFVATQLDPDCVATDLARVNVRVPAKHAAGGAAAAVNTKISGAEFVRLAKEHYLCDDGQDAASNSSSPKSPRRSNNAIAANSSDDDADDNNDNNDGGAAESSSSGMMPYAQERRSSTATGAAGCAGCAALEAELASCRRELQRTKMLLDAERAKNAHLLASEFE